MLAGPHADPLSDDRRRRRREGLPQSSRSRKEVIQPQVPLRLPCSNSHGVTGGVYKARERIHRGVLIRDY